MRKAIIKGLAESESLGLAEARLARVKAYLPGNYTATLADDGLITIEGEDVAGWTLDDYVIPRLASGLIFAEEVTV
jgi:hypothetical protein